MITDLVTGGLSGLISGAFVGWLIQLWLGTRLKRSIEHEYQKRIEEIRTESAKELSRLNSTLQETRDFKALRARIVYERKIAALCEGFEKLAKLEQRLGEYVGRWGAIRGPAREAARKDFASALQDFQNFFVPNRIFFPLALAEEIAQVKNEMNRIAMKYAFLVESEDALPSQSGPAWDEADDFAQKELPKIRRKIENEIRVELGETPPGSLPENDEG
jgi:uncharacterized Zn finger protein